MSNLSNLAIPAVGVLGALGSLYLTKRYFAGGHCTEKGRLDGKVAIVTGCNTGIGLETVGELARRGCIVVMACRDTEKAEEAKKKILEMYAGEKYKTFHINHKSLVEDYTPIKEDQLIILHLDLSDLKSVAVFVQKFSKSHKQCDLLVCNAGLGACPYQETKDGYESIMGTNHLGHCLLVELLTSKLNKAEEPRVVMVSSLCHYYFSDLDIENFIMNKEDYNPGRAYGNSKLANVLYAKHLSSRESKISAYSLHPGLVRTDIFRNRFKLKMILSSIGYIFSKSCWEGSQTTLHCCLAPREKLVNGGYYSDCKLSKVHSLATDQMQTDKFIYNTLTLLKDTPSCKDLFA